MQPNGDIDPTVDVRNREREIARTHSIFRLVAKLAAAGRLKPQAEEPIVIEVPEIVITHRDIARNPIEWVQGAIKDIRD